jgi:hypothetical protein
MGLRFQRRIRLFGGLHLNLSKSGIGLSAVTRGFHVGVDSRRRPYVSAGISGTGLSVREYGKPARRPADAPGSAGSFLLGVVIVIVVLLAVAAALRR